MTLLGRQVGGQAARWTSMAARATVGALPVDDGGGPACRTARMSHRPVGTEHRPASASHDGSVTVTESPSPRASRLPRARLDTRLLLGVLLVLLAVVLGAGARRRGRVGRGLVRDPRPRQRHRAHVRRRGGRRRPARRGRRSYVAASQDVDGVVLTRPVGRGELLPLSAVADDAAPDLRRVVIEVDRYGVTGLDKGRVVDVYVPDEAAGEDPPAPGWCSGPSRWPRTCEATAASEPATGQR